MIVPDEYDKLFCRCDGSGASFVDSSTANPKTITANGNATQIPVLVEGKPQAMFLNGSTDYVDIANSADFAYGVGAFEIEFSFMTNKAATAQTIIDNRTATADTDAWLVNIINSSGNKLCFTTATTARITGSTTLAINTKYRCKIVGNGGANGARTVIMYLAVGDGDYAQEGSTYTADYNFAKQTLRIGSVKATAGTYYNGWLKNLTLKKDSTTVLDMRGDTGATSPLAPAIYFDGTGDYLTTTSEAIGTGDFVLEGWFNQDVGYLWSNTMYDNGYDDNGILVTVYSDNSPDGYMRIYLASETATLNVTGLTHKRGSWNHFCWERKDGVLKAYFNGKEVGSVANTTNLSGTGTAYIGRYHNEAYSVMKGHLREFRISNTYRYGGAFTPSQTGFTVDSNTKLYIKGNEDNGVTTFVDSSTSPKTVTTAGDTKIKYTEDYRSCIFKDETGKFPYPVGSAKVDFMAIGSGVGYFDGSGDFLNTATNEADLKLGTGTWTMECYARTKITTEQGLFSNYSGGSGTDFLSASISSTAIAIAAAHGSYYVSLSGAVSIPINTWGHFSFVRTSGTNIDMYVNGTKLTTLTSSNQPTETDNFDWTGEFSIGLINRGSFEKSNYFNGLLDNIRISKGVARYTAAFNPPTDNPEEVTVNRINFLALL